jgi:hypothetical protein
MAYREALETVDCQDKPRIVRKLCASMQYLELESDEYVASKSKILNTMDNEEDKAIARELKEIAIEAKLITGIEKIGMKIEFLLEDTIEMFNTARKSGYAIIGSFGVGLINIPAWIYVASQETTFAVGKVIAFGIVGSAVYFTASMIGAGMILTGLDIKKENERKK